MKSGFHLCRKGGGRGGGGEEEEEEEQEEVAAGSWRNQDPNSTIMIRGLPSGITEEEVGRAPMAGNFASVADPGIRIRFFTDQDPGFFLQSGSGIQVRIYCYH